jgi:hypothetical protein
VRRAEAGNTAWAEAIVRDYEAGKRVPEVSKRAAMQVLGIPAGTLVRRGCSRGRDRMMLASQSADDDEE